MSTKCGTCKPGRRPNVCLSDTTDEGSKEGVVHLQDEAKKVESLLEENREEAEDGGDDAQRRSDGRESIGREGGRETRKG